MAFVLDDRVRETSTAPGTGSFTVNGAVQGAQTLASALTSNGDTTWYEADNGTAWETGLLTRTSATVYARTTIYRSTNGNAAVNFATGTVSVSCDLSASKAKVLERLAWSAGATLSVGDGTVALPAWSFSNDPDCGLYRIGANNIGVAVNGAKVLDIKTTGLEVATQTPSDNSVKAASTAYADAAVAAKGTAVSVTPVWATGGTPPSLGNGTLVGTVCRLGPTLLLASIKLTFGSTTSAGTGIWTFSLPSPYNGSAVAFCSGNAHFADGGVADYYGFAEMLSTQNVMYPIYNGNVVSNTVPFTWGNLDSIEFSVLLIGP